MMLQYLLTGLAVLGALFFLGRKLKRTFAPSKNCSSDSCGCDSNK